MKIVVILNENIIMTSIPHDDSQDDFHLRQRILEIFIHAAPDETEKALHLLSGRFFSGITC